MRWLITLTAFGALTVTLSRPAAASDGGTGTEAGPDAASTGDDGGSAGDGSSGNDAGDAVTTGPSGPSFQGLACDGGLCDTTNGAEAGGSCAASPSRRSPIEGASVLAAASALVLAASRRAGRRSQRNEHTTERTR